MKTRIATVLLLILSLFSTFYASKGNPLEKNVKKPRKLILDTDGGIDDAVAILLTLQYEAFHEEDIKLIAITCTHGNIDEKIVEETVLKILTVAKRNNISVYSGAERPIVKTEIIRYHGINDFKFPEEIVIQVDRSKFAAVALIDLVKKDPGELTIVALGPLTNIALATKLDSTFIQNVGELIIMGSTIKGYGNQAPNIEFNFAVDPESAFIVMNSTKKPVTLVPWDIEINFPISNEWRKNVFGNLNSTAVNFLNKAEGTYICCTDVNWTPVDARTVAINIWPNLVTKSLITNVTPVYNGAGAGTVLVDYQNFTGKPPNARIIQGYDVELYKEKLLRYFSY